MTIVLIHRVTGTYDEICDDVVKAFYSKELKKARDAADRFVNEQMQRLNLMRDLHGQVQEQEQEKQWVKENPMPNHKKRDSVDRYTEWAQAKWLNSLAVAAKLVAETQRDDIKPEEIIHKDYDGNYEVEEIEVEEV